MWSSQLQSPAQHQRPEPLMRVSWCSALSWVTLCLDICLGVMICLAVPFKHCLNFKELCWGLATGDLEWILFLRTFPSFPYLGILHCLFVNVCPCVCMCVCVSLHTCGGQKENSVLSVHHVDSGDWTLVSGPLSHLLVPSSRDSSWTLSRMISFTGDVALEHLTHQVYEVLLILQL